MRARSSGSVGRLWVWRSADLLQAMLGHAQEAVGREECAHRIVVEQAECGRGFERGHQSALAQARFAPPADELEELSGEFDLADPAGAELDVVAQLGRTRFAVDRGLHVAQGFECAEIEVAPDTNGRTMPVRLGTRRRRR